MASGAEKYRWRKQFQIRIVVAASKKWLGLWAKLNGTLSPGAIESRVRNTHDIGCLPMIAVAWVSDPVGSTVTISAGTPLASSMTMCSGRIPKTTLDDDRRDSASGRTAPSSSFSPGLSPCKQVPEIRFIEGDPMKLATNVLFGRS